MKCVYGICVLWVVLGALCEASPAKVTISRENEEDTSGGERDRRQLKNGEAIAQAQVKQFGPQSGPNPAAGPAPSAGALPQQQQQQQQQQSLAAQFPLNGGSIQVGRSNNYGGLMLGGGYPNLQGNMAIYPGIGVVGGNFPANGLNYPGSLSPTNGLNFGMPVDPYQQGFMYGGGMYPGAQMPNNFANLENLLNLANAPGLNTPLGALQGGVGGVGGEPQFQLQGQASQLQPQIAQFPLMPELFSRQMAYGPTYPSYQG